MLDTKALDTKILKKMDTPFYKDSIQKSINKTLGSSVSISAPSVSGYSFLCWTGVATSGWVGSLYIDNPNNSSANVWNTTSGSGTGNLYAYALYIKD